jgi:hypothetical protein
VRQGGNLCFEPAPGGGTVFQVFLPLPAPVQPLAVSETPPVQERVLAGKD